MLKTQGLTPVTSDQGMAVAQKMNAQYMECSSREMIGVDEIFERAILTVVANDRRHAESAGSGAAAGASHGQSNMDKALPIPGVGMPKKKKRKCHFL
jgi:GTPase SAR1 family protein